VRRQGRLGFPVAQRTKTWIRAVSGRLPAVTIGRWLAGLVAVGLVLGAAWLCARRLRRRLAPSLDPVTRMLADLVLALALLTIALQALGIVGLLDGWAILLVAAVATAVSLSRGRGGGDHRASRRPPGAVAVAAIVLAGVVVAAWLRRTLVSLDLGIGGVDSLWYHLPFATRFAQEGSIAGLPYVDLEFLTAFYPANVELLHAGGFLAFGGDALSPWLNLAFLGLGLLAGWCLGATRGAGPAGLLGAAVVFAVPALFDTQPGEAKNDAFALAVTLAAVVLLLRRGAGERDGGVASEGASGGGAGLTLLAGLAAGLAVGAKLSFLAPAGALTVAVVVLAPAGRRVRITGAWLAGLLATSGVWFARNLVATGNPLPWLDLGPLPNPAEARSADTADPLSDYLLDGDAWDDVFLPGLESALGPAWWAILALAGTGAVLAVLDRDRTVRALGVVALVTAAAYVVTPSTAAGPEGRPIGFPLNVRYLTPALLLGLCLLPVARPVRRAALAVAAALAAVLVATQFAGTIWAGEHREKALVAVAAALALAAVATRVRVPAWSLAVLVLLTSLAAWPLVRDLDRLHLMGGLRRRRRLRLGACRRRRRPHRGHRDHRRVLPVPARGAPARARGPAARRPRAARVVHPAARLRGVRASARARRLHPPRRHAGPRHLGAVPAAAVAGARVARRPRGEAGGRRGARDGLRPARARHDRRLRPAVVRRP
jgi:hypothetical protein